MPGINIYVRFIISLFWAIDLLLSALTFGAPLQPLSARFARWRDKGYRIGKWLSGGTDFVFRHTLKIEDHCGKSLKAYDDRMTANGNWFE